MIFTPEDAILLVIDIQGKLAYLMHDKDKLFKHIQALIQTARYLDIPIIYTEQVPEKIGTTVPEIKDYLKDLNPIIKKSFSCCGEPNFLKHLKSFKRKQIIICGIETHVCIYQTVADLAAQKFQVQVVEDAVSSRTKENKDIALERMKTNGIDVTSIEMLATELLRTSTHPKFKQVLNLIR